MGGARTPWYRRVLEVLVATVRHALADNVPTLPGALTYYALLSLFPALIVVVGLLTLLGREATTGVLLDVLGQLLPADAADAPPRVSGPDASPPSPSGTISMPRH